MASIARIQRRLVVDLTWGVRGNPPLRVMTDLAGEVALVDYSVTVTSAGDHTVDNTAQVAGCPDDPPCTPQSVVTSLPHIVSAKQSEPDSGASLQAGDTVTYTLTFTNDGEAAGPVDATDDVSDVLDDADVTSEPVSSLAAVSAVRSGALIGITGALQPGAAMTVTYEVTVRPDGERGNDIARNVLTRERPPLVCDAAGCTPAPPLTTTHAIEGFPPIDPPVTNSPPVDPPPVDPPVTTPPSTAPIGMLPATGNSVKPLDQLWLVVALVGIGVSLVAVTRRRTRDDWPSS